MTARAVIAAALAALLLSGCGLLTDDGQPTHGRGDPMVNDGSIEEAAAEYGAVLADARAAIDQAVGEQVWDVREPSAPRSSCDGDLELVSHYSDISTSRQLTSELADEIADAVAPVVAEAGFDDFGKVAGTDASLEYRAVDAREATFFLTLNTQQVSLGIQTGCYRVEQPDGG